MRIRAVKSVHRDTFWWVHIIVLGAAGVIVCAASSPALIRALYREASFAPRLTPAALEVLLLHAKCFLWSAELVFCLAFLFRDSFRGLKSAFSIAAAFETVLILILFVFFLQGTLFLGNLAAIVLGYVLAAAVILIHERVLI